MLYFAKPVRKSKILSSDVFMVELFTCLVALEVLFNRKGHYCCRTVSAVILPRKNNNPTINFMYVKEIIYCTSVTDILRAWLEQHRCWWVPCLHSTHFK